MTEDELKKEAEESFEKYRVTDIDYVVSPYSEDEGEKKLMFNNEYDAEEEYFRLYSKGYLASAEPREKRIAELEKENALLKGRNEGFEQQIMGLLIKYEEVYKRFPDLKNAMDKAKEVLKENAELKERADKADLDSVLFFNQLCKAKKLLKKVVTDFHNMDCVTVQIDKTIAEAEQFLNSEVEK